MQVRDVMSAPPIFVYRDTPLWRAARAMDQNDCGFLPVVHHGVAVGVITSGDLARATTLNGRCPYSTPTFEVMSSPPLAITADTEVGDAMDLMRERGIRRLVVTDGRGILRGVVSLGDIAGGEADGAVARTLHHIAEHSGPLPAGVRGSWQPEFFLA